MNWVLFYCVVTELCVLMTATFAHYRPRTLGGETLLSPGDQGKQDGEVTSTTTDSHIPAHPGKPDREE